MAAVLGIDAAWTERNDSGFALIEEFNGSWRLRIAASNLRDFALKCALEPAAGAGMEYAISCAAQVLGGKAPDLVAVDMPLSHEPIVGRRASDLAISRRFGAAKCSTHSPSLLRPGLVSSRLHEACRGRGYRLKTMASPACALTLAEIYPHPALLRLMPADERVPYKVGKTARYWPRASAEERLSRVRAKLRWIAERLEEVVAGALAAVDLEGPQGFAALKPAEDMIDAIVSAWVGAVILDDAAEGFGDESSAIWVPRLGWAQVP